MRSTYEEIKPLIIAEMSALTDKGRAPGAIVDHLKSTYEPEEKKIVKTIKKSTKKDHVVKQAQEAQNMVEASMVTPHETPANLPPESTDGSTHDDHDSTESTTDPSSLP